MELISKKKLCLLAFLCAILVSLNLGATSYNTNLIPNPGAESGGAVDLRTYGWSCSGNPLYQYNSIVTAHGGTWVMAVYSGNSVTTTRDSYIDFNISDLATNVDNAELTANLTGWLIMIGNSGGVSKIELDMLDAYGNPLYDLYGNPITCSFSKSSSANTWQQMTINEAIVKGTRKLRVLLYGTVTQGAAAFDDLALLVKTSVNKPPTVSTIVPQTTNSGETLGPLAYTISDDITDASALTISATSDNTGLIPNANITLGGSGTNRTIQVKSTSGQSGTANITIAVGDGTNTTRITFGVTVNPNLVLGSNLVTNPNGGSVGGWNGETSRFFLTGSKFTVASTGGTTQSPTKTLIYQDINLAKFKALIDAGFLQFTGTSTLTGTGECTFQGLDTYGNILWTKASGTIDASTKTVRITIGGYVGATITAVNFTILNTGFPKCTAISNLTLNAGESSGDISFVIGYTGAGSITASSSNTAIIPNAKLVITGTNYQRYINISSLANVSGTSTISILADGTLAKTFTVNVLSAPTAPTAVNAVFGNSQATVSFTAPTSNGGSAITGYTVTSNPGNKTATGTTSPITVTGLTNGTAYTFTVTATNDIGTSIASSASNSVTPKTVPSAPISVIATSGNAQASVSFSPPVSNGGGAITSYTVTSSPENKTASGAASPLIVTGLTNGTTYTFTVTATNAAGTSVASSASNSVTPMTVPDAPTSVVATSGNGQATVTFVPPVSNGGSAITSYTLVQSPGNNTITKSTGPFVVTGLTNGTIYTFTVKATNAVGTSVASAISNAVTPATIPDAPTSVVAEGDNGQAFISFNTPTSNGGSPITGYLVTCENTTINGLKSPIIFPGLTNGKQYTFTVKAINSLGSSLASAVSNSVTPLKHNNNALSFDGIDDYVEIPTVGTNLSTLTIETWINPREIPTSELMAILNTTSWDETNGGSVHFQIESSNLEISICGLTQTTGWPSAQKALNINEWQHVAVTCDVANSKICFYVNGVQTSSLTYTFPKLKIDVAKIGAWGSSRFFKGSIDELRVWNVVRSQNDIKKYMYSTLPSPKTTSGLIAYYSMNQGVANASNSAETILADSSASKKNGILNKFALSGATSNYVSAFRLAWNGSSNTSWYNDSLSKINIYTAEDLAGLASLVNSGHSMEGKTINLLDNIKLNNTSNWLDWSNTAPANTWIPIGKNSSFKGVFLGNNYSVQGIYNNNNAESFGLFGTLENGQIQNLGVEKSYIKGLNQIGGIVGNNLSGTISNCFNNANICGKTVGGIAGKNSGLIINCYNTGAISTVYSIAGGISGINGSAGSIKNSYNQASINGTQYVGGICGRNIGNSIVSNCYNAGSVIGIDTVGGIAGGNFESQIKNCYNLATVTANIGMNAVGSVVGINGAENGVSDCFYLTGSYTKALAGLGSAVSKTSEQLKQQNTFTNWDFGTESTNGIEDIWGITNKINDGYPSFTWLMSKSIATTVEITDINSNSVTASGTIDFLGTENPICHGFCLSTSGIPTILWNKIDLGPVAATGSFSSTINGLLGNTVYHIRAFSTNVAGTSYGDILTFSTSKIATDIDNNNQTDANLNIYPNPSNGSFTVDTKAGSTIVIVDITGKEVYRTILTSSKTKIDLPKDLSGLFFVNVIFDKKTISTKIVVK